MLRARVPRLVLLTACSRQLPPRPHAHLSSAVQRRRRLTVVMGLSDEYAAQHPGDALWNPAWQEAEGERTITQRSSAQASTSNGSQPGPEPKVEFFCSWFCPFAQRAWIALEEKGVNYRYHEINPYEVRQCASEAAKVLTN